MITPRRTPRFALLIAGTLTAAASIAVVGTADVDTAGALPPFSVTAPTVVSTNPADNTPRVANGRVQTLAQVGDRIFVGGTFTAIRNAGNNTNIAQKYLFAYNRLTGAIDTTFAPLLDAEVTSLEAGADGTSVFVGGFFKTVNGVARTYLVKLNASTGATVTAYTAATNGVVYDLDSVGGRLFVIGWFSKIRGIVRGGLAETNQTTGSVATGLNLGLVTTRTAWGSGVRTVNVTPDGTRLVLGGNFTSVGGIARDQLAMIDLTTAPATVRADWNSSFLAFPNAWTGTYIRDVSISPDGTYFVVGTTWYCCPGNGDTLTRFDMNRTGTDVQPEWVNFTGSDTITAVTVASNNVVYLGGHFRWMDDRYPGNWIGRKARYGLAAVDATTGRAFEWIPTRERGYGVLALMIASDGSLVVGHDSPSVGGEAHNGLASFPFTGGRVVTRQVAPTLPVAISVVSPGGATSIRTFDGAATTSETPVDGLLGEVRAGFRIGDRLVAATSDGLWVYVADSAGRWVRSWQLFMADVNSASISTMAFRNEILYFTIAGDANLHRRTMSSDSLLIDPFDRIDSGPAIDGRDWTGATGMFATSASLFVGLASGDLQRADYAMDNELNVAGGFTTVAGPGIDSVNWSGRLVQSTSAPIIPHRPNLALGKTTNQSTVHPSYPSNTAKFAVDGARDGYWSTNMVTTTDAGTNQWWEVDLGAKLPITTVAIWGRSDAMEALMNPWVMVSDTPITGTTINTMTSPTGVMIVRLNGLLAPGQEVTINKSRRYVRIVTAGMENLGVQLAEVEVYGAVTTAPTSLPAVPGANVALRQPAVQSSFGHQGGDPSHAVDGNTDGNYWVYSTTYTDWASSATNPWWQTDLGRSVNVGTIRLWNRTDAAPERLFPAKVFVSNVPFISDDPAVLATEPGVTSFDVTDPMTNSVELAVGGLTTRYVRVQLPGSGRILSLAEVEVLAQ